MIVIKDQTGRSVNTYNLKEENNLVVDVTTFQPGLYYYSLFVDGQMQATKKMVVVH